MEIIYNLMHLERKVARISTNGKCTVWDKDFLPYDLFLDDRETDFDTLFHNISSFYFWCASRMLTLDRVYAKEILNSIGVSQARTDRDRAQIALSYHCLSLTDVYWVKEEGEQIRFKDINLYENHLSNAFVDISLKGRQISVENSHMIADDLSTGGMFPKAWIRMEDGFYLLKDGDEEAVERELLASRVASCFSCRQVHYERAAYEGTTVSRSRLMTSLDYSIVSREAFEIYAQNQEINALDYICSLDGYAYHMMNILDYLVGNTDRHWGNWGLLVDNRTNRPVRLHDLMDFNRAFSSYDNLNGANCLTVDRRHPSSQFQAALDGVREIGWNQTAEIQEEWFRGRKDWLEMLERRMDALKFLKR